MMYNSLKTKAEGFMEAVKRTFNLLVKQSYDSFEDIVNMDDETKDGLRSVNEIIERSQDYLVSDAEYKAEMSEKLDDLEKHLMRIEGKLNTIIENSNENKGV